jgi:alpha-L-rhamnosidase
MYRVSAGIETAEPGYKKLILKPTPTKKLEYSKASFESPYGEVASGWERKDGKLIIDIKIPANTTATIILPSSILSGVTESGNTLSSVKELTNVRTSEGKIMMEAGSGEYHFEIQE